MNPKNCHYCCNNVDWGICCICIVTNFIFLTLVKTAMLKEAESHLSNTNLLKESGWFTKKLKKMVDFRNNTKKLVIKMRYRRHSLRKTKSLRLEKVSPFCFVLLRVCSAFFISCTIFSFEFLTCVYIPPVFVLDFQIHATIRFLGCQTVHPLFP